MFAGWLLEGQICPLVLHSNAVTSHWVTSISWEKWQVLKCVRQTSFICQITAPCISRPSIFCLWGGRAWSASKMRARLESVIRAWMHWHLLQAQGIEMIFLRTPVTIYNHVFQENSQYSRCREQRPQAVSNSWANLPASWGILPLAWSRDSHPGARCGRHWWGRGRVGGSCPASETKAQAREQDWSVHCWNAHRSQAAPTCPTLVVPKADQGWEHYSNTSPEALSSASADLWHWVDALLFGSFSAQGQADGEPQEMPHTSQPPLLFQLLSVSVLEEIAPYSADNPSTQQAASAAITSTPFLKIPSEPEFWLHWHLTNHFEVLTYAFVSIFISPRNISFRCHCLLTF